MASAILGYEKITGLSAAKSLTVPTGATWALVTCDAQAVRWRDDGTAPTAAIGFPLAVNQILTLQGAQLAAIQLIEQTGSAVVHVSYYKS